MNSLSEESHEMPLSPESKPMKTSRKSVKVQVLDPLPSGSVDLKRKSSLEPEKKRSLKRSGSAMPVPRFSPAKNRIKEALKRLGVKPEELENAPEVTPLLKSAEGGLKAVLGAMRFSTQNETIKRFVDKYDSIPLGDRERLPWEAIVIAAELDFDSFMGAVILAVATFSSNKSKIIIASSHPKVTKARVKYALMAGGDKDRFAIDTMVGALPSPKGPTFIGKAIFGGAPQAASSSEKDEEDDIPSDGVYVNDGDLDNLFPPSSAMQEKLIPIRQKLLE